MLGKDWKPSPPRPTSTWKLVSSLACFLTVWGVVLTIFDKTTLTVIVIGLTLPTSFVGGYFFRADLQRRGAAPPLSFLRVEGDDEHPAS